MRRLAAAGLGTAVTAALVALPPPARAASSYHVTLKTYAFHPAALNIKIGDTVTWTNQDTAAHNVVTTSGPATLHSPMLPKGRSWSFTFRLAGTYAYYCSVHPDMRAQIVVAAAASTSAPPTASRKAAGHGHAATPTPASASASASASPGSVVTLPTLAPVVAQPTAAESRSLNPLLPLTGLVCAVAVFCLLLLTSAAGDKRSTD